MAAIFMSLRYRAEFRFTIEETGIVGIDGRRLSFRSC